MKKKLLSVAMILSCAFNSFSQNQSIVIQKNTLPDANQVFNFASSGPVGSAFASSPTISLNNPFSGRQPLEVGASSTGNGYIAFTQKDAPINAVYTYASGAAAWTNAALTALRLDYESSGKMWLVGTDNNLYENSGGSTTFRYGGVKDVGVGADDKVYLIGFSDHIYRIDPGFVYTDLTPTSTAKRLDGGPGGTVWYIGSNDHIYYFDGTTHNDRGLAPGNVAFIDIAVGADGKAWGIGLNPSNPTYTILYYWNGSSWIADTLAPTGTTMFNVTVGADLEPIISLSFNGGRTYLLKRLSDGRWVEIVAQTSGNNNTVIYYNQPTGNYSFTETVAAGYYLQDIIIFGSNNNSYSTTTGNASIVLSSNDHAYVQYTNVSGTKPAAQSIANTCGSKFVETFGTGTPNVVNSLPAGQTTYTFNNNPMGKYQGNGINDGQYALTTSVYDATGYFYQWISGPGVNGASCSYTCDIHGDASYGLSKVASDTDHTAGDTNGQMLLVNADFSSGVYYQKEYTGLVPGNSYQFSAWIANVLLSIAADATDPNVILRVVDPTTGEILLDQPSGDILKTGSVLTWVEKKGSFLAPASGTVKVYLINNKPGGQGNDLVLDDISFEATCHTISGQIFNDANGMTDNLVNGIGTNTGAPLYAVLTDENNIILNSVLLPSNGQYSFPNLFTGTYSVKITTEIPAANGNPAPNSSHTNGWLNTGTNNGVGNDAGSGNFTTGNLDSVRVIITTTNVTAVDFGLQRPPLAEDVTAPSKMNPGGTDTEVVPTLNGSDPEDGTYNGTDGDNTIIIQTLPTNGLLYYDNVLVTLGDTILNYDPTKLVVDPIDGTVVIVFTYSEVDAAGIASIPATVTMPFTPTLPVTLVNFNAIGGSNNVTIQWQSSTEINSSFYSIEKSGDGIHFTTIGNTSANGIASNYQWIDAQPNMGVNYYRLKMIDKNGTITYSKIISIRINNVIEISVAPNPIQSYADVYITLPNASLLSISIIDIHGRNVFQNTVKGNVQQNHIRINNLDRLANGVYYLQVKTDSDTFNKKIIKLSK